MAQRLQDYVIALTPLHFLLKQKANMFKLLFDIFPVILFFASYKWGEKNPEASQELANQLFSHFTVASSIAKEQAPIILATAIAIAASIFQIGYLLISRKKIDAMLWISFIIISVFGSATIYFQSDVFIKWKPTIIYWCYAGAFLLGQYVFKKNLLKALLGSQLTMPEDVWNKLGLAWVVFFIAMGALNLYVAFHYSQSAWVSFKLYSIAALPLFLIGQSFFIAKYIEEPK